MKRFFNKASAVVAIIILLGAILTVNIMGYVHETKTPSISTPIISVSGGAGVGSSGSGGSLLNGGFSGSGGAGIGVDGSGNVPAPTVEPTGISVDENDFIGEEQMKGNE